MAYPMPPAVAAKVKPGHTPVYDGGRVERWTCTTCGRAVLRYGFNIYGSATTEPCTPDSQPSAAPIEGRS